MENRIKYWRDERGLTQQQLADLISAKRAGTKQPTINRLETGEQKLTVQWMQLIADALGVAPSDLLSVAASAEIRDDVEPYDSGAEPIVKNALKARNLGTYRITSRNLSEAGFAKGSIVMIDHSQEAIDAIQNGDVVLASASVEGEDAGALILRQYLAPGILSTNRAGRNVSVTIGEKGVSVSIRGVASHPI